MEFALDEPSLTGVARPLLWLLALGCALNLGAVVHAVQRRRWPRIVGHGLWVAAFALLAAMALAARPVGLPEAVKVVLNATVRPTAVLLGAAVGLTAAFVARRWLVRPPVAWLIANVSIAWLGLSLVDPHFRARAAQPDNFALLLLVAGLGFFLWLAAWQATQNDDRRESGIPSAEAEASREFLVWPDLVYIELIAALLVTTGLIVWSLVLPAPLEGPADPAATPNPSRAPWYFVGLQELLSYGDAWWVGVMMPFLAFIGLAAIPYLDRNSAGVGHYSIAPRRFAIFVFLFGFLVLWIVPILVGSLLRGPNWASLELYEPRTPHAPREVELESSVDCR
jgi:hypothetical protein